MYWKLADWLILILMLGLGVVAGYFLSFWFILVPTLLLLYLWFLWKPKYDPPPGIGVLVVWGFIVIGGAWGGKIANVLFR